MDKLGLLLLLKYKFTWFIIGLLFIACIIPQSGFYEFITGLTAFIILIGIGLLFFATLFK